MKKLFIIPILFATTLVFCQKKELGKVTINELKEKACPIDTSAAAAVVFENTKITYDPLSGQVITETEMKIKIYKKEGYKFADIDETYVDGSKETVSFSNVATYNLKDGQIVKTKLSKDGEFTEKVTKNVFRKKITLSDIKEGSIIEYRMKKFSNNTFSLVDFYFQDEIPVLDIELNVEYPNRFVYTKQLNGFLNPEVKDDFYTDASTGHTFDQSNYKLKNVPALKEEGYVNNINNYRTSIRYELSAVKNKLGVVVEKISTDWESVVKKVYEHDTFGGELKKTGYFEKDLDLVLAGLKTQQEKINGVFKYVQTQMTWDEDRGLSCDEGVKKAYQDKKGNVAEINLMLTAMLRYAGIEANPILISTRSNGISLFPSLAAYDYVISGVELQDQVVLLDATDKYAIPDILPVRDLNWFGRIIRKNESSAEINLMPKTNSKDNVSIIASIDPNGEISGKIRDQYFDYNAFLFRQANDKISKDSYIEKLEKRHQGLEVGDYDVQNSKDLEKPLVENYSFKATNSVETIGDKMYISPFLFFTTTENPFKQETREYPVDFVFPHQDKFSITLTLPEGYAVETLPENKAIGMDGNLGSFKYIITNNGNQIQLSYIQDINQAIIASEHYLMLKDFYKQIVNKQTEKIVLKKV